MELHRIYVGDELELRHDFWVHDAKFINEWVNKLGLKKDQDIVLINDSHERLYKIAEINSKEAHLLYVTDFMRKSDKDK